MKKLPNIFLFVKLYYIMINFLNKNKYLFLLILLTIGTILITFYHNIGLIIDCGREAYYPQEILNGKVLYKDLFNIYGPFAYIFNALLFKIFGINLKVLCCVGGCCALTIITTLFLITKKLFNDTVAFSVGLFALVIGVVPVYVFNYVFPYAFAMTYGLAGFLISLLFLIYYINSNNNRYLYISLFFAGLCVSCKYEFIPYLFVYLPVFFIFKPKFLSLFLGLLYFCLIPEMCFVPLFTHGLTLGDLHNTFNIILNMSHTQTLKYFYIHSGVFPCKESLFALSATFLAWFIPFFIYLVPVLFKDKIKNPVIPLIFTYSAFIIMLLFKNHSAYDVFLSIPLVLFVLAVLNYKKLLNNLSIFIIVSSAFLVSIKIFWGAVLNSYGIYYLPLLIIAIFLILKDKFTEKEWNYIAFYVLILSILIGFNNLKLLHKNQTLIQTQKGKIYTEKKYETTIDLLKFIENETKPTDKILILPEGMMINFLANRKTDDFYNSMLPLYEEAFGITSFREHFKKGMPKYVIFNTWDSSDYYFSLICKDYGLDFCDFVKENYFKKFKLSGNFSYTVFEKK